VLALLSATYTLVPSDVGGSRRQEERVSRQRIGLDGTCIQALGHGLSLRRLHAPKAPHISSLLSYSKSLHLFHILTTSQSQSLSVFLAFASARARVEVIV